jgi:hypothetical protein
MSVSMTLEDLHSAIWSALRKYITEALLPIVHFRRYKAFNNMTRSEFYSPSGLPSWGPRVSALAGCS